MKFRQRLVVYYLIATITTMFFVGFAVLKGIERLNMETIERQLMDQSRLTEIYISQIAFLDNPDATELSQKTSNRIITSLGFILGNVRIYDKNLNLLASSEKSTNSNITVEENNSVLSHALSGNYAYIVREDAVYFSSPLDVDGKTFGLLEIIYPLNFLTTLLQGVTNILLIGAAAFAVIMTLLSTYIAGRVTRPIKQLVSASRKYANRDFSPVRIKGSDEIAELCRSFNAMGSQLNDYIQRQKLFVSNVSHELRTPLTAIKGYSEFLVDEVKGNPYLEKAVFHLNNESARLAKLVDELLTLSRIDAGREDFNFRRINISLLVEETLDKMKVRSEKYKINIQTKIMQELYVSGDEEKLIQVLVNLLDNAIKFSPSGADIRIDLYKENDKAALTIEDEGIGIPKNNKAKVFERFYRSENAKGISGTGLGLSIVKNIVDAHKGTIELVSGSNGGTVAILRLPIA